MFPQTPQEPCSIGEGPPVEPFVGAPRAARRRDDVPSFTSRVQARSQLPGAVAHRLPGGILEEDVHPSAAGTGLRRRRERTVCPLQEDEALRTAGVRVDVQYKEAAALPGRDADVGVRPAAPPGLDRGAGRTGLLDISLPRLDGREVLRRIRLRRPEEQGGRPRGLRATPAKQDKPARNRWVTDAPAVVNGVVSFAAWHGVVLRRASDSRGIRTTQCGGRNPASVTVTSRRTAASDGRLLAAARAWRQ